MVVGSNPTGPTNVLVDVRKRGDCLCTGNLVALLLADSCARWGSEQLWDEADLVLPDLVKGKGVHVCAGLPGAVPADEEFEGLLQG